MPSVRFSSSTREHFRPKIISPDRGGRRLREGEASCRASGGSGSPRGSPSRASPAPTVSLAALSESRYNQRLEERGTGTESGATDVIGDFLRNRIEYEDAQGHPLSWQLLGGPSASTPRIGELPVRAFVSGFTPPARLYVYRLYRLATEIPFEFVDVPSP